MLCSDSACVTCFNLTSRWCSFIRRLTILSISPMYTCPQKQGILYIPAELSGGLWSLGFLKICPIFLGGLKIVWILCDLFNILPIRSVVPLTYGRMDKILSSDYVSETIVLFACLLIVLIMSFLSCPFFCKAIFKWLSSVCRCSLSEMVKALCTSELIVFVLSDGADSACRYLSVCWFSVHLMTYIYIYILFIKLKYIYIYNKAYRKLYKFYLRHLFIYFTVLTIITLRI